MELVLKMRARRIEPATEDCKDRADDVVTYVEIGCLHVIDNLAIIPGVASKRTSPEVLLDILGGLLPIEGATSGSTVKSLA